MSSDRACLSMSQDPIGLSMSSWSCVCVSRPKKFVYVSKPSACVCLQTEHVCLCSQTEQICLSSLDNRGIRSYYCSMMISFLRLFKPTYWILKMFEMSWNAYSIVIKKRKLKKLTLKKMHLIKLFNDMVLSDFWSRTMSYFCQDEMLEWVTCVWLITKLIENKIFLKKYDKKLHPKIKEIYQFFVHKNDFKRKLRIPNLSVTAIFLLLQLCNHC